MADAEDPIDRGERLVAASKLTGTQVYDRAGARLGTIFDVAIDAVSGRIAQVVLQLGGFGGPGHSYHLVPWESLTYQQRSGGYVLDMDRAYLEAASDLGRSGLVTQLSPSRPIRH